MKVAVIGNGNVGMAAMRKLKTLISFCTQLESRKNQVRHALNY